MTIHFGKIDIVIVALLIVALGLFLWSRSQKQIIPTKNKLGIEDLIKEVKKELLQAENNRLANTEKSIFQVKGFDLEINFVVKEVTTINGELRFEVVTAGHKQEYTNEKVQKIKLYMTSIQDPEVQISVDTILHNIDPKQTISNDNPIK